MSKFVKFIVLSTIILLTGCAHKNSQPILVTNESNKTTFNVGETAKLKSNLEDTVFVSSNESIAKVNDAGVVTFYELGEVTINCYEKNNKDNHFSFDFDVIPNLVEISNTLKNTISFQGTLIVEDYDVDGNFKNQSKYELIKFHNENRYSIYLSNNDEVLSKIDYFKNQDGNVVTKSIDNHNEIIETIVNPNAPITFDESFINPFNSIDITKYEITSYQEIKIQSDNNYLFGQFTSLGEDYLGTTANLTLTNNGNIDTISLISDNVYQDDGSYQKCTFFGEYKNENDLNILQFTSYPNKEENKLLETLFSKLKNDSYTYTYVDHADDGSKDINAHGIVTNQGISIYTSEGNKIYSQIDSNYYNQSIANDNNKTLNEVVSAIEGNVKDLKPNFDYSKDLFLKQGTTYTLIDAYDYVEHLLVDKMFTDNYYFMIPNTLTINLTNDLSRAMISYKYDILGQLSGTVLVTITNIGSTSWTYDDYELLPYDNRLTWMNFDSTFVNNVEQYIHNEITLIPFYNIAGGYTGYNSSTTNYAYLEKQCNDMEQLEYHGNEYQKLLLQNNWLFSYIDEYGGFRYTHNELENVEVSYELQDDFGVFFFTIFIYYVGN